MQHPVVLASSDTSKGSEADATHYKLVNFSCIICKVMEAVVWDHIWINFYKTDYSVTNSVSAL